MSPIRISYHIQRKVVLEVPKGPEILWSSKCFASLTLGNNLFSITENAIVKKQHGRNKGAKKGKRELA